MIQKLGKRKPLFLVVGLGLIVTGVIVFLVHRFKQAGSDKKSINSANSNQPSHSLENLPASDTYTVEAGDSATDSKAQQVKANQPERKSATAVVETVNSTARGNENINSSKGGNSQDSVDQGIATNQLKDDKKEIKTSDSKKGTKESKKIVVDEEREPQNDKGSSPDTATNKSEPLKQATDRANTAASGNKSASCNEPLKSEISKGDRADADDGPSGTTKETSNTEDVKEDNPTVATKKIESAEQKENQVDNTKASESNDESPKPDADFDVVKAFKSAKMVFIEYLKAAIFLSPNDTEIQEGYGEVVKQLASVLKETPTFTDTEDPIMSDLEKFVQEIIMSEAFIQEQDQMFSAECEQDVDTFEARFKVWLEWVRKFKITFPGRTTPDWITFTKYSEAKLWCIDLQPANFTKTENFMAETVLIFKSKKTELDALLKKDSAELVTLIREAKTFRDLSFAISGNYADDSADNQELNKELNVLHLNAMARYLKTHGEEESIVKALHSLADHVSGSKISSFECAKAWGNVIINVKDFYALDAYYQSIKDHTTSVCTDNQFPNVLFDQSNEKGLKMLRDEHKSKTAALLSAESTKDVLGKISVISFNNPRAENLNEYFRTVSLFFKDPNMRSLFSNLCPFTFPPVDGNELLSHLCCVVKKTVNTRPQFGHSWDDLSKFVKIPYEIIRNLEAESEDPVEIAEWTKFATDYELIMASGLKNDVVNEAVFDSYRLLKKDFTEDNLKQFLDLILKNPVKLSLEFLNIGHLVASNCEHSPRLICEIVSILWRLNDAGKVATNVMKIRNGKCIPMFEELGMNSFRFPFLLNILDDDVVKRLCTSERVTNIPRFEFKKTDQFKNFVASLTALQSKLYNDQWEHYQNTKYVRTQIRSYIGDNTNLFTPRIQFLTPSWNSHEMQKYLSPEILNIVKAYRELADVIGIGDENIEFLMKKEADNLQIYFKS